MHWPYQTVNGAVRIRSSVERLTIAKENEIDCDLPGETDFVGGRCEGRNLGTANLPAEA